MIIKEAQQIVALGLTFFIICSCIRCQFNRIQRYEQIESIKKQLTKAFNKV